MMAATAADSAVKIATLRAQAMAAHDWPYPISYQTAVVMPMRPIFAPLLRAPLWPRGSYGEWLLDRIGLLHRENRDAADSRAHPRPDPYEPPRWITRLGEWMTALRGAAVGRSAAEAAS